MLRSLYSGVSGLRNHQVKMDVLGNNIANINSIGFKGGRTLFSAALSQMVSGASKQTGAGFLNPVQIGLGMKTGSIDKTFTQGALETTGNVTDLAIQGDGFFIVESGDQKFYTRAGNFTLNPDGTFVNSTGLLVQGWMLTNADIDSDNLTENSLTDISIDSNIISNAEATENMYLSGNLNVGLRPIAEVWTSGGTMQSKAIIEGAAVGALTVTGGANDEFVIEMSGHGSTVSETITLTAGAYGSTAALITEINNQITANSVLNGTIEAVDGGAGNIKFRSTDSFSSTQITLNSGTNDVLTDLGFTDGASGSAGATVPDTTDLNDTLMVTSSLVSGDTITISGTNPDGTAVSNTFTYAVDGTTIQDLVSVLNASYTGTIATFTDGQIVLTDTVKGDSDTTISLISGTGNTGEINLPGFFNTVEGYTGETSTSAVVYDSMGGAHNLVIEFTKTENTGEWTWEASVSGEETITSGGTGRVIFDANGQLTSFTYDNGVQTLSLDPGNGANGMDINIVAQGTGSFSGLSQFESVSTLNVREQDGRATGYLLGLIIDPDGMISGTFSNGETVEMAKIALAQFGNNQGLMNIGNGLYEPSISSGDAMIFGLDNESAMTIESGSLEMSNVDLSRELTDMITAQRGFQANSKIITTSDQMIDELLRMKR